MIVRQLLTRIGYDVDKKTEDRAKSSFDGLKSAAKALGSILLTGVVAQGLRRMVEMASDVEETMNVVTLAFEDQTETVLKWAKVAGDATGRSEFAMREYAATIGSVIGPTVASAETTAQLSTDMAQLAVDLGSVFQATDIEALQALRSGLIGQAEPLLRFGVAMNVASLDAFALEEGLGKTTKQMTEAEKIALRYRFILARTAKAQGDATRTAGGFANLSKALNNAIRDLQVEIGMALLPAAAGLLQVFVDTARALRGPLRRGLQVLGTAIRGLMTPFKVLAEGIRMMPRDLKIFSAAFIAAMTVILAPMVLVVGLVGLIALGIIALIEDIQKMGEDGSGVIAGLIQEFWHWVDETDSVFAAIGQILKQAVDFWIEVLFGVPNATDKIMESFGEMADGIMGFIDEITESIEEVLQPGLDNAAETIDFFAKTARQVGGFLTDISPGFGGGRGRLAAEQGGPGVVNAAQTIEVNVNAPGGNGPEIAAAVAPAVGRAAGDVNRRTAQQLLVGGGT